MSIPMLVLECTDTITAPRTASPPSALNLVFLLFSVKEYFLSCSFFARYKQKREFMNAESIGIYQPPILRTLPPAPVEAMVIT